MTEPNGDMRSLVEQIAHALVDAPDQVQVTAVDGDQATVLELRVAPTDLGKVIGKSGEGLSAAISARFHGVLWLFYRKGHSVASHNQRL